MNYVHLCQGNLRLVSRNEGKIKSYDSSVDLRSWSHDSERRSRYLQEWMKSDMPINVVPMHTLAVFLNNMTCKSRRKVTPKCHPDCKSKLVLDSIRNSCHAMQECLKSDKTFNTYFQEEEFETCYWPCERCLEVLKNIKMFWKIVVDKVLNIKITKAAEFNDSSRNCHRATTVHSVAKMWEQEIMEQAMFVKKIIPLLNRKSQSKQADKPEDSKILHRKDKESQTIGDFKFLNTRSLNNRLPRKITRYTSVKIQMVDADTNTSNIENEEIEVYKRNVEYLQEIFNRQEGEMANLKRENNSLKLELENFYDNCSGKPPFHAPIKLSTANQIESSPSLPQPFESCTDETTKGTFAIDSEMIITMKSCTNENFKHVSLLQVLHKTNEPIDLLDSIRKPSYAKENPIELLTKVRNTFGELVRREIYVANKVREPSNKSEISASYCRVNASKSEPTCSKRDYLGKTNFSSSDSHVSVCNI